MLDYSAREKKVLPVRLADGTSVTLTAPKKSLFTRLASVRKELEEASDTGDVYDEMLSITADILSNNKEGVRITAERADSLMDIEDMALLLYEYSSFAGKLVTSPN